MVVWSFISNAWQTIFLHPGKVPAMYLIKKAWEVASKFGSVSYVGNAVLLTAMNAVHIILADLLSHCFMTWILYLTITLGPWVVPVGSF